MGVLDGQPVNQSITNAAFLNKNADDVMPNKLGFNRLGSGTSIADIQQAVNNIYTATGVSETQSGTVYDATANTINNGDPYQTALTKLADKFDPATGHMHTGAAGDGPLLPGTSISGVPLLGYFEQGSNVNSVTGSLTDVTSLMSGKIASSNSTSLGVVVSGAHNKLRILAASGSGAFQEIHDTSGNLVYGRITASAATGGTWTLSYYSEISGTETPYTFSSATDLMWWYQELFNPVASSSVYNPTMEMFGPASGSTAVSSLAASGGTPLTGAVTLSAGSGITLTESGQNIQIAASGGGGTGTGTGAKNYLSVYTASTSSNTPNAGNGDFELGSTTGWSLFHTTLTGVIPTGSIVNGASSINSFSTVNSNTLAEKYSLETITVAAWSAGQGFISDAFYIDLEDQAKVLTFKAYYKAVTGASNADFSGTSSNTFAVYIYDVTNSAWIQPAGVYGITQSSGVGYVTGTFQTTSNSTQYRVAILAVNASAGAMTMYWDDIFCGPQTAPFGPAMTDWQSYSLAITGSTSNPTKGTTALDSAQFRRVGDSIQIMYNYSQTAGGSAGSGTYLFALPSGYSIDTSKLTLSGGGVLQDVGTADAFDGSTLSSGYVVANDSNHLAITVGASRVGSGFYPLNAATIQYSFIATVPIAGLSSNVQMSNDTDTRVCAARYSTTSGQAFASGAGVAIIDFDTQDYDTHGAVTTGASWNFTAPIAGKYSIKSKVSASFAPTTGSSQNLQMSLYKNGSAYSNSYSPLVGTDGSIWQVSIDEEINLSAGDYIDIRFTQNSGNTQALSSTAGDCTVTVERLSGPSVIAATESVNAKYTSSTTTITGPGNADIIYPTKVFDSHNAYNTSTGIYTAPISGKYRISASFFCSGTLSASGANQSVSIRLYKNGSLDTNLMTWICQVNGVALTPNGGGTATVSLLAGDTVNINIATFGTFSLDGSANNDVICIERIGN